jgi:5-methyltetrahydrofolate--homocysteine methyltransferase
MPKLVNGKTVFDMGPEEFQPFIKKFYDAGVNAFGGCCGTTPEHIAKIKQLIGGKSAPKIILDKNPAALTSQRKTVFLGKEFVKIGERINPTGKKILKEELKEGKYSLVKKFAIEQRSSGADILDVNVGVPNIDELKTMKDVVAMLVKLTDLPLCIDSSDPKVFEDILKLYPGRALINSISYEKEKMNKLLPIAKKYGAMFILLPLSEAGIPKDVVGRQKLVEEIYAEAQGLGLTKNDIVLDGLVMTVSTGADAAQVTLSLIDWAANTFGVNTTVGLSNVSFGLPDRELINSTFLAVAKEKGLTTSIINPDMDTSRISDYAKAILDGSDKGCVKYVEYCNKNSGQEIKSIEKENISEDQKLFNMVVDGNEEDIKQQTQRLIEAGLAPQKLVDDILIPAIQKVGDLYEKQTYFLPQLMMSAKAMQEAFVVLEPLLVKSGAVKKGKIVIATVKGDIHDIGKNIVVLMLKNNGFEVIDLGKDIDSETIIKAAKKADADLILLSALMTTTMTEMPKVIELARKEKIKAKIMVGGAVVDDPYAQEIGADGYSKDAAEAVAVALKILQK